MEAYSVFELASAMILHEHDMSAGFFFLNLCTQSQCQNIGLVYTYWTLHTLSSHL